MRPETLVLTSGVRTGALRGKLTSFLRRHATGQYYLRMFLFLYILLLAHKYEVAS